MSNPSNGGGSTPDRAWADALLEGERPARDTLVPPMITRPVSATSRPSYVPEATPRASYAQAAAQDVDATRISAETAMIAEAPVPESAYPDTSPWGSVLPPFGRSSFDEITPVPLSLPPLPAETRAPAREVLARAMTPPPMPPLREPSAGAQPLARLQLVPAARPLAREPSQPPSQPPEMQALVNDIPTPDTLPPAPPPSESAELPIEVELDDPPMETDDELAAARAALDRAEGVVEGIADPSEHPSIEPGSAVWGDDQPPEAAADAAPEDEIPDLTDTADLVELEALDQAFASVFMTNNTPTPANGVALISATTGDLVYPPTTTGETILRTEAPLIEEPARPPVPVQSPLARRREMLPPKGDVVLGIDLGTTYTCAAVVEAKHASVLASRWGSPTIPSVVAILPDGRTLVGESALRYSSDPRRVIAGSKRIFGRSFHSPIVQEAREHFAYEIVEGAGGDAAVKIDDQVIELETVSAAILREIRESASLQIDGIVNRAVITCPAHFNERQRESIRVAGEMAGFHVERVLSEPTSAALHFGLGRGIQKRKVLVYDLGGGTFDVSLLEVDGDTFAVIGTGGDTFLGGMDFDACIADLVVEAFLEKEHIDARSDPVAVARILEFAERAKRELTDRTSTIVQIDHLTVQPHAPRAITVPVKRTRVEELWTPLVDHTIVIVEQMLARAGVKPDEVHEVLLVGGQSRTPLVQKRMEQLFGRKLPRDVNPEEAIALGAAQLGDTLAHASKVTLVDVLPMSIGVGLPGGRYKRILEREAKLPAERSYTLRSTRDNQTRFEVMLFQGEDESVENDEPLGVVELNQLPKGPKGSIAVIVTLRVNAQQVLEIEARETKTGKSVRAQLATRHTTESMRRKLGLPSAPSQDQIRARVQKRRSRGVWGWLTGLFGRK